MRRMSLVRRRGSGLASLTPIGIAGQILMAPWPDHAGAPGGRFAERALVCQVDAWVI